MGVDCTLLALNLCCCSFSMVSQRIRQSNVTLYIKTWLSMRKIILVIVGMPETV